MKTFLGASSLTPPKGQAHLVRIEAPSNAELSDTNGHTVLKYPLFEMRVILSNAESYTFLKNSSLYKRLLTDGGFNFYEHTGTTRYVLGVRAAFEGAYTMCRVDKPRLEDLAQIEEICKTVVYVGSGTS